MLYELEQRRVDLPALDRTLSARVQRLVSGVMEHRDELDAVIDGASEHWRVGRMPAIDRTVLRLGLYELRYEQDTPVGVVLSEAVRLAKAYSTERSGAFVNGVLARLARQERGRERGPAAR